MEVIWVFRAARGVAPGGEAGLVFRHDVDRENWLDGLCVPPVPKEPRNTIIISMCYGGFDHFLQGVSSNLV